MSKSVGGKQASVSFQSATTYLPKLDGLRAVSIALVLAEHFVLDGYGLGGTGVTIFFVISGYLITSILISYADTLPVKQAAITFYWRRSLRLFPVYYLCIGIAAALGIGGMRQTWWINGLYLTNFKVAIDNAWNGSSHFWSLCIEEQFYLLWFLVVVVMPRKVLLPAIIACIFIAPFYRGLMHVIGMTPFVDFLLPGVMDSLATGALLSYLSIFYREKLHWQIFVKFRFVGLMLSLGAVSALYVLGSDLLSRISLHCFVNVFSACLVALCVETTNDQKSDWLRGKLIRHLGKISYGIYVYHYFVPELIDAHMHFNWLHSYTGGRILRVVCHIAASVGIAEVSWYAMEKPILKLKDRFSFETHQGQSAPLAPRAVAKD